MSVRLALVLVIGACSAKAHEPVTHQIEIKAMKFVPAELEVSVGDTIVWTNRDVLPHTVTSASFDSLQIDAAQQWMWKVTAPGDVSYRCTFHPTMLATLRVR